MQGLFCNGKQRKMILRNAHYITLFNNPLDMTSIYAVAQRIMPKKINTFLQIFKRATSTPHGYLFIDGKQKTPGNARFRTNIFDEYQKAYSDRK